MASVARMHADPVAEADQQSLRLWLQLMKCTKAIEADVAKRLRRTHGQSLARFDVLSQLVRCDEEWVAVGTLAEMVMASSGNITALLDRMEADGLVERRASPTDRRSYQIRMTAAGRRLFDRMNRDHARWVAEALDGIAPRDKDRLITLLVRVRRAFESPTAP
jgi:DNA-binding MarR family transcriptional regulator